MGHMECATPIDRAHIALIPPDKIHAGRQGRRSALYWTMATIWIVVRVVMATAGWSLFFYWWWKVTAPGRAPRGWIIVSIALITFFLLASVIYSVVWISHNKRVARKGKRGFVSFYKPPQFANDALGRRLLLLPVDPAHNQRVVIVKCNAETKEYVAEHQAKGATQ